MAPAYSKPAPANNFKEHNSNTTFHAGWEVIVGSILGGLLVLGILFGIFYCCKRGCCGEEARVRRRNRQSRPRDLAHREAAEAQRSPVGQISSRISQEDAPTIVSKVRDGIGSIVRSDTPVSANHRTQEPPKPIFKKPASSDPEDSAPNEHRSVSLSTILSSLFPTHRTHRDTSTDYTKSGSESDGESVKSSSSSVMVRPMPHASTVPPTNERFYGLFPHLYTRKNKDTPVAEESKDKEPDNQNPPPASDNPSPPISPDFRLSTDSSRHTLISSIFSRRKHNSSGTHDLESNRALSPSTIQLQTPPLSPNLLPNRQFGPVSFITAFTQAMMARVYPKNKVESPQAEQSFWVDRGSYNSGSWIQRQEQIGKAPVAHTPVGDGLQKVSISPLSN